MRGSFLALTRCVDGQSVMPEGLLDALADDQGMDLVRYVQLLK